MHKNSFSPKDPRPYSATGEVVGTLVSISFFSSALLLPPVLFLQFKSTASVYTLRLSSIVLLMSLRLVSSEIAFSSSWTFDAMICRLWRSARTWLSSIVLNNLLPACQLNIVLDYSLAKHQNSRNQMWSLQLGTRKSESQSITFFVMSQN